MSSHTLFVKLADKYEFSLGGLIDARLALTKLNSNRYSFY